MKNLAEQKRYLLAAAASVVCTLALSAPAAQAGPLVQEAAGCPDIPLEQPFVRWMDQAYYQLVPGGSFEATPSTWALSKAKVVSGNETFYVRSKTDSKALQLPAGSAATSRVICVGMDTRTLRFFVRASGTSSTSKLKVETLYENAYGQVVASQSASLSASSKSWAPTPIIQLPLNLLPLIPGERTPVKFRFTPVGSVGWWIDDVYVDPKRR
jgi:hypothetical protein